ncbi:hypothetical protein [Muricoccus pecuniae]|uniref:Uncharacterized protein n=1 Tax=Muricoccus pecuniae TaxID=693023 RepID=A0A840Y6L5_9PROT|nr:hypothetical protein [Roseomonas pecuniae]MBB5695796.1 hypothetical protein [Roseomonas pecuniae]
MAQLRFYAAPAPSGPADPSPLAWLSNEGQAAYIAQFGRLTRTPSALRSELATPPTPRPASRSGQPLNDRTQRLLVATLSRPGHYNPGDRITRAVIYVVPRNFTFGSYSVVQTERQTVDITKLRQSSQVEASITASGTPARVAITPEATIGSTQKTETETNLQDSQEKLTVDIEPSCMRIVQEGARNTDITGNIRIQAAIVTESVPERCRLPEPMGHHRLTPDAQRMTDLQRLHVIGPELSFRDGRPVLRSTETPGLLRTYPNEPLVADVVMFYTIRRVISGLESYLEGNQHVRLINGVFTDRCQVVLSPVQSLPPLYAVLSRASGGRLDNVFLEQDGAEVLFSDPETARSVATWIRASQPTQLGTLRLREMTASSVSFALAPPHAKGQPPC